MTIYEAAETLGVEITTSINEVTKIFKKLARKYHPDICKKPECEEKFKKINEAYNIFKENKKETIGVDIPAYESFYKKEIFEEWLKEQVGEQYEKKQKNSINIEEINIKVNAVDVLKGNTIKIKSKSLSETIELQLSPFLKNKEKIKYKTEKQEYIINIEIIKEQGFSIDKEGKITKEIYIPYIYFLIGGKIIINNLEENFILNLPPKIKDGQILKIPNKALNQQDLYIKLYIKLQTNGEEKELKNIQNKYYNLKKEIF